MLLQFCSNVASVLLRFCLNCDLVLLLLWFGFACALAQSNRMHKRNVLAAQKHNVSNAQAVGGMGEGEERERERESEPYH